MKILVAEDDPFASEVVRIALTQRGHEVVVAADGALAWEAFLAQPIDVIVSDWFMPRVDGLELCRRVRAANRETYTYFILLTASRSRDSLLMGIEAGADDFLTKPLDADELSVRLIVAGRIASLHRRTELAEQKVSLLEEHTRVHTSFEGLVGRSLLMQDVFRRIKLASQTDVTVLFTGESGTGKELAAQAIHVQSARRERPFLAVNCGAIPESLLESELFGHTKGAFTNAHKDKIGFFEAADGGTLFLDEIGDVTPLLQLKLLRALQEREIRRVGDDRARKIDVRIVGATNRDLKRLVADGSMREDFYYRIRVFEIALPPLRARREDIPLIVERFVADLGRTYGKVVKHVAPEVLHAFMDHDWPGNVRELRNAIEHCLVVCEGDTIRLEDLPPEVCGDLMETPRPVTGPTTDDDVARIKDALAKCGGSRIEAARLLGISRVTLWKRLKRFGL